MYVIHFKFVAIKDMHNIYYLGLSGEQSLPFGLLVLLSVSVMFSPSVCLSEFWLGLSIRGATFFERAAHLVIRLYYLYYVFL